MGITWSHFSFFFNSFLTSDLKKPTCFKFIFNASAGYDYHIGIVTYPEDALKINVKHVGFFKSDVRNESK